MSEDISDRSRSDSRSSSSSRVITNRDRIRCYRCREYNHFARECPIAMMEEEEPDHSDTERATLQILTLDSPDEQNQIECLNI